MDATTRAVQALTTAGVLGPWVEGREPLAVDEAMAIVAALTQAEVPPQPA